MYEVGLVVYLLTGRGL